MTNAIITRVQRVERGSIVKRALKKRDISNLIFCIVIHGSVGGIPIRVHLGRRCCV